MSVAQVCLLGSRSSPSTRAFIECYGIDQYLLHGDKAMGGGGTCGLGLRHGRSKTTLRPLRPLT